jgi:prevent-host-death family protein
MEGVSIVHGRPGRRRRTSTELANVDEISIMDIIAMRRSGMKVTSTEFKNGVGRFQDAAMRQPVEITKNGRTHTVLISADYYELLTHGRIVRRIEDIDRETLDAIAVAEVPTEYAHLDKDLRLDAEG